MLNLIPRPQKAEEFPGKCLLPDVIGVSSFFEKWCLSVFAGRMERPLAEGEWLRIEKDPSLPEEGYALGIVPDGVTVRASAETGVIRALTTLAELYKDGGFPCCSIEDAPKYPHRGLHFDCSRHYFPVGEVKRVIEEISLCKMNVLHWHLTDDQGWRIESKKFPALHEVSGKWYTHDEIRDIVEFARLRGIEVVPEIDMPGHMTALLAAYPQYSCTGKKVGVGKRGGIYPVILCGGNEEVFAFIEEILCEVIPLFPSERFHIGGDEAPKSHWKKCPKCAAKMRELGLTGYEDLQGYFTSRVNDMLKKHGKTAVCWHESLKAENCPEDIQIHHWTPMCTKYTKAYADGKKGKWIYSDTLGTYLDYPHSITPLKKIYASLPVFDKISYADDENLLGMECCIWTERVADRERLETRVFPRAQALAEAAWSGAGDYEDFKYRLKAMMQGRMHRDIFYTPESWWDPKGFAAFKEKIGYIGLMVKGTIAEE